MKKIMFEIKDLQVDRVVGYTFAFTWEDALDQAHRAHGPNVAIKPVKDGE